MSEFLVLVLAADAQDYRDWCESSERRPLNGTSAWALSVATGHILGGSRRTFQVTERWRERPNNRRLLADLQREGLRYGDEGGAWPEDRIPDLRWPSLPARL